MNEMNWEHWLRNILDFERNLSTTPELSVAISVQEKRKERFIAYMRSLKEATDAATVVLQAVERRGLVTDSSEEIDALTKILKVVEQMENGSDG